MKKIYQKPSIERVEMSDAEHLLKGSTDEVYSKQNSPDDDGDGWNDIPRHSLWDE